ncbi:MAG: FAD/NAD(P)-binding protein [Bacteroidia bacterium]|nr:FAD/NAD(P)-binding protein [Bacteroidia bacterium]
MKSPLSVAIIGGGFNGIMTLVHLVKNATAEIHISLFYKSPPLAAGIAFKTYSEKHLLNVAARNMSAFPNDPGHFIQWVLKRKEYASQPADEIGKAFLPRNLYGLYLNDILESSIANLPLNIKLDIINEEVTGLTSAAGNFSVTTKSGHIIVADKVVLATGNQIPGSPLKPNHAFLESSFYHPNPWVESSVDNVQNQKPILIIGTGLTMVDVVLGLLEKKYSGKIIAISPRGFHILPHRPHEVYSEILSDIKPPYDLSNLLSTFRAHIRKVKSENRFGEAVVDAFRSKTQEVWQALSKDDKKRFMVHIRHLWGVARHRLPAGVHANIQDLIKQGRLEVIAGRIVDVEMKDDYATARIKLRNGQKEISLAVQRIINCTGPEADPSKFNSTLFRQLISDNMIIVDDMRLGIFASPQGEIYDASGKTVNNFYTLGTLLRGTLWETTAVPELRVQAENTAQLILKD